MRTAVCGRTSDSAAAEDYVWTAAFFNERFPDVVSPLGWSIVGSLVERSALREPLEFIGYRLPQDYPLTKVQAGRIYTNVGVFQRLYRLFPAALVPSDAARYFPQGDLAARLAVAPPPPAAIVTAVLHTLLTEAGWSPWNYRMWARFVPRFDAQVASIRERIELMAQPEDLLRAVKQLMQASLELLRLHRWSLTYADVVYDLLQRLLAAWVIAERAGELSADLVSGLENRSTATDQALRRLAVRASRLDAQQQARLEAGDFDGFMTLSSASQAGRVFRQALESFLREYGYRSPSLDVRYPAYADAPGELLTIVARLAGTSEGPAQRLARQRQRRKAAWRAVEDALRGSPLRRRFLSLIVRLAQRYSVLREDQRFYWQKSMSAKRLALTKLGVALAHEGRLGACDDVFYLTLRELTGLVRGWLPSEAMQKLIAQRQREIEIARDVAYAPFLIGRTPLATSNPQHAVGASTGTADGLTWTALLTGDRAAAEKPRILTGLGASPGQARGRAVVLTGPAALQDVLRRLATHPTGEQAILVASATDPAWTPLFMHVVGLALERGGQLSHGAVVAREYGLPAVVGVKSLLEHVVDGAVIRVDGVAGTVTLES